MITIPKGTKDVLPSEAYKWHFVEGTARRIAALYNLKEIRTPVFEHTELFARGVGDTTDIVNKEMYTFLDKGDRSMTLKPEGTAGVVRAAVTSICFLYALKKEERFDSVNALSLSVIVLLAAAPMSLFDIGFLMSVSAVLGILAFYTAIRKCFYSEGKLASFLASSVAVSLSANTLLIGISASVFGTFALYFVIANVIAVPYISLIYFFLVPISLFALIIPPIGYLLVPFKYLLQGFIYFSQFISALPFATLEVRVSSAVAAVYSLAVLFVSKFNLLPKKVKIAYAGVSGAVIALLIVL